MLMSGNASTEGGRGFGKKIVGVDLGKVGVLNEKRGLPGLVKRRCLALSECRQCRGNVDQQSDGIVRIGAATEFRLSIMRMPKIVSI